MAHNYNHLSYETLEIGGGDAAIVAFVEMDSWMPKRRNNKLNPQNTSHLLLSGYTCYGEVASSDDRTYKLFDKLASEEDFND